VGKVSKATKMVDSKWNDGDVGGVDRIEELAVSDVGSARAMEFGAYAVQVSLW
jgi:hypothetical protein